MMRFHLDFELFSFVFGFFFGIIVGITLAYAFGVDAAGIWAVMLFIITTWSYRKNHEG